MTGGGLDLSLVLFWTSLGVSAAVVALFLWLMREDESDRPGGAARVPPAQKEESDSRGTAPAAVPPQDARS